MNIENGMIAGVVFVVVMQILRQIFANAFSYMWQNYACNIVPSRYRCSHWFTDKNSLFYVDRQSFRFKRFTILTHGNMRSVTIYFAFVFWIFATHPIAEIREGTQALLNVLVVYSTFSAMLIFVWCWGNGDRNPDVFIITVFNALSIAISFSMSLLILNNLT